jgi:hypothetical protein
VAAAAIDRGGRALGLGDVIIAGPAGAMTGLPAAGPAGLSALLAGPPT